MTQRRGKAVTALILLASAAMTACGNNAQTQTAEDGQRTNVQPPQPGEPQNGDQEFILSFHDDPIVIDNAPFRVGLGRRARYTNGKRRWTRTVHAWDYMAIIRRDETGAMKQFDAVVPLCRRDCKLVLGLVRLTDSRVTTDVTFALTAGPQGEMSMSDRDMRQFKEAGRWLEPYYPNDGNQKDSLRIRYVTAYDDAGNKFFEEDLDKYGNQTYDNEQVDIAIITRE